MYHKYRGVTLMELIITLIISVILLFITSLTFLEMIYHYGSLNDVKYAAGLVQECSERIIGYYWINNVINTSVCDSRVGIFTINVRSVDWSTDSNFSKITVTATGGTRWQSSSSVDFLLPKT